MDTIIFGKLRNQRVSDEVAARIREEIEEGRLGVGSRLPPERVMADQLGVSRPALREAIRTLEQAGILRLERGPSGGAFVQNKSREAIVAGMLDMYSLGGIKPKQLTQARIVCEGPIIRLACEMATQADYDMLNSNIDKAEESGQAGNAGARIRLHLEFHRLLAGITQNPILMVITDGILELLLRFLRTIGPYDSSFVTPSRRRFMAKFIARDAAGAIEEMETLLTRLEHDYLSRLSDAHTAEPDRAAPR